MIILSVLNTRLTWPQSIITLILSGLKTNVTDNIEYSYNNTFLLETNPFASFGAKNTPSASPLPKVHDSTKKKLAQFGADASPSKNGEENEETRRYKHMDHPFLQPDKIMVILQDMCYTVPKNTSVIRIKYTSILVRIDIKIYFKNKKVVVSGL